MGKKSGELKGTIEYVNVRGDNHFTLYSWCGPKITCYFQDDQLTDVLAAMTGKPLREMIVKGTVKSASDLDGYSIHVESIQKAE